jgi:hypothetical protein
MSLEITDVPELLDLLNRDDRKILCNFYAWLSQVKYRAKQHSDNIQSGDACRKAAIGAICTRMVVEVANKHPETKTANDLKRNLDIARAMGMHELASLHEFATCHVSDSIGTASEVFINIFACNVHNAICKIMPLTSRLGQLLFRLVDQYRAKSEIARNTIANPNICWVYLNAAEACDRAARISDRIFLAFHATRRKYATARCISWTSLKRCLASIDESKKIDILNTKQPVENLFTQKNMYAIYDWSADCAERAADTAAYNEYLNTIRQTDEFNDLLKYALRTILTANKNDYLSQILGNVVNPMACTAAN